MKVLQLSGKSYLEAATPSDDDCDGNVVQLFGSTAASARSSKPKPAGRGQEQELLRSESFWWSPGTNFCMKLRLTPWGQAALQRAGGLAGFLSDRRLAVRVGDRIYQNDELEIEFVGDCLFVTVELGNKHHLFERLSLAETAQPATVHDARRAVAVRWNGPHFCYVMYPYFPGAELRERGQDAGVA